MTYDPYQTYLPVGINSANPANVPFSYGAQQTVAHAATAGLNPFVAAALGLPNGLQAAGNPQNPSFGQTGFAQNGQPLVPGYAIQQGGISPQQIHWATAILAAAQGLAPQFGQPLQYGSPYGQQQQLTVPYQNNPYQNNPYQMNPYQANQVFGQGIPYGSQLAPQSWIGQPGVFAQNNPLANQFGQRSFQTPFGY